MISNASDTVREMNDDLNKQAKDVSKPCSFSFLFN